MIPLSLTLNGIYSYKTQQTIDFTHLTKNHLFGIFGPVGSGKSTILEAISYALYGETERLNAKDGRNYNMMNLKSNALFIDFIFKAGEKNADTFRFTVKGTRDKKYFDVVKALDRKAYKQEGETWIPIDCDDIEKIIGLSYDNFRRTIIIPQGKFQEFLQLTESERTQMMKEIFNLERYDLARKTDLIDKQNSTILERIKGQLIEIGHVDQSMIDDALIRKGDLGGKRTKQSEELEASMRSEKTMEDTRLLINKMEKQKEQLKELESLSSQYQKKERQVEQYEVCLNTFPDILKQHKELNDQIVENQIKIKADRNALNKLSDEMILTEKKYEAIKPEYEQRHKLEVQWKELEMIESILQIDKEIKSFESNRTKLDVNIAEKKEIIENEKLSLKNLDTELKQFKKELPDDKELLEIKRWFDKNSTIQDRIHELKTVLSDKIGEVKTLESEIKELLSDPTAMSFTTIADRKLSLPELIEVFHRSVKELKLSQKKNQNEIEILRKTEVLETFADELKEGEACPLCGAEHHPHLYAGKGVKTKVESLQRENKKLDKSIEDIQELTQQCVKLNSQLENERKSQEKASKDLNQKKEEWEKFQRSFEWSGYTTKDEKRIDNEIKSAEALKKRIVSIEGQREKAQETLDSINELLTTIKEEYQTLSDSISESNGKRKTLFGQIKYYDKESINQWTSSSIKKEIAILKNTFDNVEEQYKRLDGLIKVQKEKQSNLRGTIQVEENNLEKSLQQLSALEEDLKSRLTSTGIKDVKIVIEVLANKLNLKSEKELIRSYYEKVSSAKDQLIVFQKEVGGRKYDENRHRELQTLIEQLKGEIRAIDQEIGQLEKQIKDLTKSLKKRAELESKREKLELKAANIKVLKTLFRGGGFVNYASRIYLENLCGIANHRFTQLTRQRLRLELRDDNTFQIRDFLNDGKVRSVKTLSGGQTFQASLSLALALADNIQQFARSDKNFFFLDEGFGTLDKDSLQIVFDALKSLRQENRVVGVISHVEELQQEIDNYIKVELDSEMGSIISVN